MLVLIRGAGDLASGIALRLKRAGIDVVMTDLERSTAIRRTVCFSQALTTGRFTVEDVTAVRASAETASGVLSQGEIPVLADPEAACRTFLRPDAIVDAILAKKNLGTRIGDAPIVVACGPDRDLRRALTAMLLWKPCGATIWGGSFMRAAPCPTPASPDSSAASPVNGSCAPRRTGCFARYSTLARQSVRETWPPRWTAFQCYAPSTGCSAAFWPAVRRSAGV